MHTFHFRTVDEARAAGVNDKGIKVIVEQVRDHRQMRDADRAKRKTVRTAARRARRAGRA